MSTACIMLVDDADGAGFRAVRMLGGGDFDEVARTLHEAYDELWRRQELVEGGVFAHLTWNPGDIVRMDGPPAPESLPAAYAEGFDNYYLYVYDDGTWRWRTPTTAWLVIDHALIDMMALRPGPEMGSIGNYFRVQ